MLVCCIVNCANNAFWSVMNDMHIIFWVDFVVFQVTLHDLEALVVGLMQNNGLVVCVVLIEDGVER